MSHVPDRMVRRGDKEVVTVEIFKETYEFMKSVAEKKSRNTKEYISNVLGESIERDRFLQNLPHFYPRSDTRTVSYLSKTPRQTRLSKST